jgi:hypothetical protein
MLVTLHVGIKSLKTTISSYLTVFKQMKIIVAYVRKTSNQVLFPMKIKMIQMSVNTIILLKNELNIMNVQKITLI